MWQESYRVCQFLFVSGMVNILMAIDIVSLMFDTCNCHFLWMVREAAKPRRANASITGDWMMHDHRGDLAVSV